MFDGPLTNKLALISLICAKFIGLVGVLLGFGGHRTLAMSFLIADGVLILATVAFCVRQMHKQNVADRRDVSTLEKMLLDGTLHQKLRDAGLAIDTNDEKIVDGLISRKMSSLKTTPMQKKVATR